MRIYLWLWLALFPINLFAIENSFEFSSQAQEEAFHTLTKELRCPMCQNQNIADSDAMIAHDMRRKVFVLLQQGKSETDIINYMKDRYGDFVYYKPPVTFATVWLWLLPVIFIITILWFVLRRKNTENISSRAEKLRQADALLNQDKQ